TVAHLLLFAQSRPRRAPLSFPTRRSSDLRQHNRLDGIVKQVIQVERRRLGQRQRRHPGRGAGRVEFWLWQKHLEGPVARYQEDRDRKSTRLNSSHVKISYAVFCLKKKQII